MQIEYIATGAFIGALAAYAVKGLVDLLFHRFGNPDRGDPHADLAESAWREIDRVRRRQRTTAYREFDEKLQAAVHEMQQGWNRMSLIYAARDRFISLQRVAPDPVTGAARRMCNICIEMMERGYTEASHNRYHRARLAFHEECRRDLSRPAQRGDDERPPTEHDKRPRRRYITPR